MGSNALINQLLQPYTIDANGVRSISNLQRFPKPLELCGGGSKTVWGETVLAQQLEIKPCWRNRISSKLPISVPLSFFIEKIQKKAVPAGAASLTFVRYGSNQQKRGFNRILSTLLFSFDSWRSSVFIKPFLGYFLECSFLVELFEGFVNFLNKGHICFSGTDCEVSAF